MKIKNIEVKIILDSRGKETLEAVMYAERSGIIQDETRKGAENIFEVSASVPSGKSTGSHEVFVLEPKKALEKFDGIKHEIISASGRIKTQREFDKFLIALDGTKNKSTLEAI